MLEAGSSGNFNLRHSNAFESLIHLYLYRSDVARALIRFESVWPRYEKSMLLRIRMTRIDLLEMRARCALAMAEKPGEPGLYLRRAADDAHPARKRRAQVGDCACALYPRRHRRVQGRPGSRDRVSDQVGGVLRRGPRCRCGRNLLRYRLGEIQAGPETRALHDQAEQWIKGQGIVAPARWAGMYAPGFAKIAGDSVETTY